MFAFHPLPAHFLAHFAVLHSPPHHFVAHAWPRLSGRRLLRGRILLSLGIRRLLLGQSHCGYAEAWNLRLFKHALGRYEKMPVAPDAKTGDNEAHEHVELRGTTLRLVHELDHYAYPTISSWVLSPLSM